MLRPALRAAVVTLVTALALVGLVPATAQAAVAAPASVVVVPGSKQVSVGWKAVKGAKKYTVQVSSASSFAKSKTRSTTTTKTTATVKSLTQRKTYWVRVKAAGGSWSKKQSTVPSTNSPRYKEGVKVTAAGTDKVKVSWPKYVAGTSLKVVASWSNENVYTTGKGTISGVNSAKAWITSVSVARTSVVLTVPAKWRALMGSKGTEPVYVHLYAKNGSRTAHSVTAFGYPSPPALTGSSKDGVTFATWNIASSTATADIPGRTWSQRKAAVTNGILKANASVVAVQEAAASQAAGEQYQQLVRLLSPTYKSAVSIGSIPVPTAQIPTAVKAHTAGLSRSDHILYKPTDVTVLDSGVQSTYAVSGSVAWDKSKFDRQFTWALMQSKATGHDFYVVSTHLEQGTSATMQKMRKAAAAGVRAFIENKAKSDGRSGAPIVIMGDLNSDSRWTSGPQVALVKAGYASATAAHSTVKRSDTTSNSHNASKDHGYPAKPYNYKYTGTRIDYILVKNGGGVSKFVNQMILTSSGRFNETYRGSDHNLQWARIRIP